MRARAVTARGARTGCARCAAPTPAARSWHRTWAPAITSTTTSSTGVAPEAPSSSSLAAADESPATVVAVDCNGADLGAAEVAAGAALAAEQGVHSLLFGPAEALGAPSSRTEVVAAPLSIAKRPDSAAAVRAQPRASIVQTGRALPPRTTQ